MVDYVNKRPTVTVSEERKKQIAAENAKANREFSQKNARGALRSMGYDAPEPTPAKEEVPVKPEEVKSPFPSAKGVLQNNLERGTAEAMTKPSEGAGKPKDDGIKQVPNDHIGVGSLPSEGGYVPNQFVDEYEDGELFPPALFNTPAQDYWSTAEPANEEEKRTFHSNAFQQSALTFGLSLLLGNSVEDSLYTGMQAYAQSEYINTEEYAELANSGVPEEVIRKAFNSGDWTQVKSWEKDIQDQQRWEQELQRDDYRYNQGMQLKKYELEQKVLDSKRKHALESWTANESYRKSLAESLQSKRAMLPEPVYNDFAKRAGKLSEEIGTIHKKLSSYDPNSPKNPMEQIGLTYDVAKLNDEDSAVKEGELTLNKAGIPWTDDLRLAIGRIYDEGGSADVISAKYSKLMAEYVKGKMEGQIKSKTEALYTIDQDIARGGWTESAYRPWYGTHKLDQYAPNQLQRTASDGTVISFAR